MTTKTWPGGAWSFTRFGGLGAIGFAALIVGANLVLEPAGMPVVGADIEEVNTFFTTESGAVGLSSSNTPAAWWCVLVLGAAS
ncbi:hypothetical protein [Nocardia brasiliensis]|uniref:hypothetical protein n=1 Tax=Nocardia brasiliensis TaxID=37326 RepID=UPI002458C5BA|nr:hypothetical protein [Nocardia brasiliensis]